MKINMYRDPEGSFKSVYMRSGLGDDTFEFYYIKNGRSTDKKPRPNVDVLDGQSQRKWMRLD